MRTHRFFVGDDTELKHEFWLHDARLIHQWRKVLRFAPGQQVVLFDGRETERLYRLESLDDDEAHLVLVTDMARKLPARDVYLAWALLKNDKNDWVVQKGTELGVRHFVPLITDRSEKSGLNMERAQKIIIEAAEQCGRGDIPNIREPQHVQTLIDDFNGKIPLVVAEQLKGAKASGQEVPDPVALLIGPEGGWSDTEKELFLQSKVPHMSFGDLTLRAETAAVTAAAHVLSKPDVSHPA